MAVFITVIAEIYRFITDQEIKRDVKVRLRIDFRSREVQGCSNEPL